MKTSEKKRIMMFLKKISNMNPDAQFLFRDCVVTCDISDSDRIGSLLDVNIPKGYSLDYPDGRQGQIIKVTGPFSRVIGTIFCIDLEKEKTNFEGFIPYTKDMKVEKEKKSKELKEESNIESNEDEDEIEELNFIENMFGGLLDRIEYKFSKRAEVKLEEINVNKSSVKPVERPIVRKPIEDEEEIVTLLDDDLDEDYDIDEDELFEESPKPMTVPERLKAIEETYKSCKNIIHAEYCRLKDLEKELVDDAIAEGLEGSDPEFHQMAHERTVDYGSVLFYMGMRDSGIKMLKSLEQEFADLTVPKMNFNIYTINTLRKMATNNKNMLTGAELAKHNLGKLTKRELVEILTRVQDKLANREVRHILSLRK